MSLEMTGAKLAAFAVPHGLATVVPLGGKVLAVVAGRLLHDPER
jgi:hypothetical protein